MGKKSKKPRRLSALALKVLQDHQAYPRAAFYDLGCLGGMFRDVDVQHLDAAYQELDDAGLVEPSGKVVRFFSSYKHLYRLTANGQALKEVA
jgi:hypothetical protein